MCELYNAIFMTLHEPKEINDFGYCGNNSTVLATKILASASDWESLVKRCPQYRNPKHILLGIVVYRMTRSKALLTYLNKSNCCISYNDVLKVMKHWEGLVKKGKTKKKKLEKGIVTHSSIDNIDEETESISLHFTNSNLFQPNPGSSIKESSKINVVANHPGTIEELPEFYVGKKIGPKLFQNYSYNKSSVLVDKQFIMVNTRKFARN